MVKFYNRRTWYCGSGWYPIIEEIIEKITPLCEDFDVQVSQIKEKFGQLCFFVDGATKEIYDIIREYENKSLTICEECGKEGKYRNDLAWKQTLCKTHYKETKTKKYNET